VSKDKIEVNMNVYDIPILVEVLEKANKEIKRLNNIINELEKYINEEYIYDELGMKIFDASELQDKLQELKGSDKE
jgi:predicted nucleotidyltransferase